MYNVFSLGAACQTKFFIDRFTPNQRPGFFDRVLTDFQTILFILQNIENKNIISPEKFVDKTRIVNGVSACYPFREVHYTEQKMIFIHDFITTKNFNDQSEMNRIILKYHKRLDKMKNVIKDTANVHMVHVLDYQHGSMYIINNEDINMFFGYINKINPNNRVFLHIAIPPKYNDIDFNDLIRDRVYIYYLTDTSKESGIKTWNSVEYNWNIIFDNINKIG